MKRRRPPSANGPSHDGDRAAPPNHTSPLSTMGRTGHAKGPAATSDRGHPGQARPGFSATCVVNRADFGLTYNAALELGGVLIGDKVKIEIEIEASLEA